MSSFFFLLERVQYLGKMSQIGRFSISSSLQNIFLKIDKILYCFENLPFISFHKLLSFKQGELQESKLHIKLRRNSKNFLSHSFRF